LNLKKRQAEKQRHTRRGYFHGAGSKQTGEKKRRHFRQRFSLGRG
jgi:hypothetical protein